MSLPSQLPIGTGVRKPPLALHLVSTSFSPIAVNPAYHVRFCCRGTHTQRHVLRENKVTYQTYQSSKIQACRCGNFATNLVDCVMHVRSPVAAVCRDAHHSAIQTMFAGTWQTADIVLDRLGLQFRSPGGSCCFHGKFTRHAVNMRRKQL